MVKKNLSSRLSSFMEETRNLIKLDSEDRAKRTKQLEREYRDLQAAFANLSEFQTKRLARQNTDASTKVLIDHLVLGRENVRKIQRPVARLIEKDPHRTDWAVSEFMTTLSAFKLIQDGKSPSAKKKEQEAELDEQARRLLAGMLGVEGVELTAGFVKKVRGELLAGTVAYAHSHLCKKDVKEWHEDSELRKQYKDNIEDYLCDCITRANIPLIYRIAHHDNGPAEIACAFLEGNPDAIIDKLKEDGNYLKDGFGSTALRLHADAFCVNHEDKVFIIGGATTKQEPNAKQLESLVRFYVSLEFLIENDPRYKDYQIKPFFFHSGYFCASEEGAVGQGRDLVMEFRENGMSQEHVEALSRMAFFNLLSEENPSPTAGRVFSLINPHVAGCVTLEQQKVSEKARVANPGDRAAALSSLGDLAKAAEAMASPAFSMSVTATKSNLIEGLINSLGNFYMLFPVEPGSKLSNEEKATWKEISKDLKKVAQKVKDSNFNGKLTKDILRFIREIDDKNVFMENVDLAYDISLNKGQYIYSKKLADDIRQSWVGVRTSKQEILQNMKEQPIHFLAQAHDPTSKGGNLIQEAIRFSKEKMGDAWSNQMENMIQRAQHEFDDMNNTASKRKRPPNQRTGIIDKKRAYLDRDKANRSFVQGFRNLGLSIQKNSGGKNSVESSLFRVLGSYFGLNSDEMKGKEIQDGRRKSYQNSPDFIMACLNSGDEKLMAAAKDVMGFAHDAEVKIIKKRKMK